MNNQSTKCIFQGLIMPYKPFYKPFYLASLAFFCFLGWGNSVQGQSVFVSPTGNNSNAGTSAANPLRTFQAGADLARTLGSGTTVEFANGQYGFDQTVVLDASYSGLTFQAAPGATPVFSSLTQVTGWTPYSGNSNIMVADLPAGISHVRYLQDASENWLQRSAGARFSTTELAGGDDGGCIECNNYTQSTQPDMSNIQYSGPAIDWSKASQYDLRASTLPWHQEILPIASYNSGASRIQTAVPGLYDLARTAGATAAGLGNEHPGGNQYARRMGVAGRQNLSATQQRHGRHLRAATDRTRTHR